MNLEKRLKEEMTSFCVALTNARQIKDTVERLEVCDKVRDDFIKTLLDIIAKEKHDIFQNLDKKVEQIEEILVKVKNENQLEFNEMINKEIIGGIVCLSKEADYDGEYPL